MSGSMKGNGLLGPVDKMLFYPVLAAVIFLFVFGFIAPESFNNFFTVGQNFVTKGFGSTILLISLGYLIIGFVIAFSPYGHLKLGKPDDTPDFTVFEWIAMLFCAGLGIGFTLWATAEPLYHYYQLPAIAPGVEAGTPHALPWALSISIFDWGVTFWAMFSLVGLAIAVPAYRLDKPMNIGAAFYGLLGEKAFNSGWQKIIDSIGSLATIAGITAQLGLGIIALSYALEKIWGVDVTLTHKVMIMLFIIACYTISAISGIENSIRLLSKGNAYIGFFLIGYIVILGPTSIVLNNFVNSIGHFTNNFLTISTFTDTIENSGWIGWWTMFYALWWLSYAPFCGGFLARISKGRTIREFMLATMLIPGFFSIVWMSVIGGYSIYLDQNQIIPLWEMVQANAGSGVFEMVRTLPLGETMMIVVLINYIVFCITTTDSASYFLAMQMSGGEQVPVRPMRILWGIVLGSWALFILTIGDGGTTGFKALQKVLIVIGSPYVFIMMGMIYSLYKMLRTMKNEKI